jgi:EmrB/QacA subfamily drug resistance transporter
VSFLRHRTWALGVVASAQFVLLLDLTIVNIALPSIQSAWNVDEAKLQWLVTGYALTFGGFLLLAGRAADVFGRRRLFVVGMLLFGVASLAAGLAVNELMLVAARAGQGLGGAAVSPAALALLTTTFPEGPQRNRALGVFAVVASAGGAFGLILGGAITQGAGWRWIFLVNVPIAAAAAVVGRLVLRESRNKVRRGLDVAGAMASTVAVLALVYGLTRGGQAGFGDPTSVAALSAAVLLTAAFVVAERRADDPLIPVHLLRSPTLLGADLTSLTVSTLISATPFLLTLYMQRVLDLSPVRTGLAFLPMTLTVTVTTTVAARCAERIGLKRLLLFGVGAVALAAAVLSRASADGRYVTDVLPGMLVFAVGLGASYTAVGIGGTAGVSDADQGVAGGLLSMTKQVGGAVGLAVLAVVVNEVGEPDAPPTDIALVDGLSAAYLVALGFPVLAVLAATTLIRTGRPHPEAVRSPRHAARADPSDTRTARPAHYSELCGAERLQVFPSEVTASGAVSS